MENQQAKEISGRTRANPPGDQAPPSQLESEDTLEKFVDADTSTSTSSDYMGPSYNHRVSDPYEYFDGIFARAEEQGILDEVLDYYGMTRDDITPTRRWSRARNEAIERDRETEDRRVVTEASREGPSDFGPRSPLRDDDAVYSLDAIKESSPLKSLKDLNSEDAKGNKPDKGGQTLLAEYTTSTQRDDSFVSESPRSTSTQATISVRKRQEPSSDNPNKSQYRHSPQFAGNPPLRVHALHKTLTPKPAEDPVQEPSSIKLGGSPNSGAPLVADNPPLAVDSLHKAPTPEPVQDSIQDSRVAEDSGASELSKRPLSPPIAELPPTSSSLPPGFSKDPPLAAPELAEPPNPDLSSYSDPPEYSPKFPSSPPEETQLPGYWNDPPEYAPPPPEHVAMALQLLQAGLLVNVIRQAPGFDEAQAPAVNAIEPANNENDESPASRKELVLKENFPVINAPQTPELEVSATQRVSTVKCVAQFEPKASTQETNNFVPLTAHKSWYSPEEAEVIPQEEKKGFFSVPGIAVLGASAVGVAASILGVAFIAVPWWKRRQVRKQQAAERVKKEKLTTRRLHARHWRHEIMTESN